MSTNERNFEITMQVRDYECDQQRVVSNINYLNYLEHARQQFFISLLAQTQNQTNLQSLFTVSAVELNYVSPLTLGDDFLISVSMTRQTPHQITFQQDIVRLPDRKAILEGAISCTLIDSNPNQATLEALNQLFGPVTTRS
jgi:acyl-CoA thioester hydrolase